MRYAQGGGLTAERRRLRERIRYEAGERFARGEKTTVIAKDLRVSERSVERWRRAWREGGMAALASAGPPKLPRLSDAQFAELEKELALGPAAHGWEDQRWSLARIRALIAWRFQIDCSMAAVWRLMHRHGWSWQCPRPPGCGARRGCGGFVEEGCVAAGGMTAAALGAFIVFEDEAGFSMTPPVARTWGRRGHTPVVRVRGRSWRRFSIAAMCCYKPGETSRLIYRPRRHRKHKGKGRDTFAWSDYRDLVVRAHIQLGTPIVLIWDNLNTHRAAGMREYAAAQDWLTIVQLPSYAPDLNPVEGIWSLLRRGPLANVAFTDDEHLEQSLRRGLRHIQLRPDLIDGCLAGTGLTLTHLPTTIRGGQ
ncbi:Transposase [Streptomyces sp. OV198]|jgi:putative transposase|uniref:IS630 family transposase n=1 Tax=Streptomyces sp. OV198 TaxID=1882787 RepID=UPI000BCC96C1|nr:Transposase [Streptomyces sp. OV198]